MTLTLRVLQAPEGVPEIDARRLEPGAGPVSIGRGPDSDWVLPDPERHVSKLHCRIESQRGRRRPRTAPRRMAGEGTALAPAPRRHAAAR